MLKTILFFIGQIALSLRYKITIKGLDKLKTLDRKKGVLFLPNHPAEIDPVILYSLLYKDYSPSPLTASFAFDIPILGKILKKFGAMSMPEFDTGGNAYTKKKAIKTLDKIARKLDSGRCFIFYPSGRLKRSGVEVIGGASGAYQVAHKLQNATIVMVRTTGLWGSSFSRALTHASPNIAKTVLHAFKQILLNGIVFLPRRKIVVEFEIAPDALAKADSKVEFNRYLEDWYNAPFDKNIGEPLKLVPYQFWSKKLPEISSEKEKEALSIDAIPKNIQDAVIKEVARITKRDPSAISPQDHLSTDLGMDSLDVIELVSFLDEEFEVRGVQPSTLETVIDAMSAAVTPPTQHFEEEEKFFWPKESHRRDPSYLEGKTLQELFLKICDKRGGQSALGDNTSGVLSYKRSKLAALILADKITNLPGDKVGILMPATAASLLFIMATLLAKKSPVMLNWTIGSKNLGDVVAVSGVKAILSSEKFLEKAKVMDLEGVDHLLVPIEHLRRTISLKDKLRAIFKSSQRAETLLKTLKLNDIDERDCAVILFTSGTESTPKGVPLSHKNILSNQRAAFSCVNFKASDVIYSFLPPFHSFGFSITTILPFITGLRVAFSPDPTDGAAIAHGCAKWEVTLLCSAPTFLKVLLNSADKDDLSKVRLVVAGAEKAPKSLYEEVQKLPLKPELLEGYGITECSPILTLNLPGDKKVGVGKPLPGISIKIIDISTNEELKGNKEGMIIASGPNIFQGYLQKEISSPFIELEGKQWYVTGDLGYLNEDGSLILSGRLKRFVKVGGEMINLVALEEALSEHIKNNEGPQIAIIAEEKEDARPKLILFSTLDYSLDEVNRHLKEAGFSNLAKISEIKKIEALPLLGTGKIDYRTLNEKYLAKN